MILTDCKGCIDNYNCWGKGEFRRIGLASDKKKRYCLVEVLGNPGKPDFFENYRAQKYDERTNTITIVFFTYPKFRKSHHIIEDAAHFNKRICCKGEWRKELVSPLNIPRLTIKDLYRQSI